MANRIKPKRSFSAAAVPSGLESGELAINVTDKKVFVGNQTGTGNVLLSSMAVGDLTGTVGIAAGGTGQTTAAAARNALLPPQVNQTDKQLVTDGSNVSWVQTIPTGCIQMFGGFALPAGWLMCNGAEVSRTTYAPLFAALGTIYGTGDGSTTFHLPNLQGRMPVGAGIGSGLNASGSGIPSGSFLTTRNLGQWGGEETHQLTVSEMPSHSHNLTTYAASSGTSGYRLYDRFGDALNLLSTNSVGGNGRHATMPPFIVVHFIIKT